MIPLRKNGLTILLILLVFPLKGQQKDLRTEYFPKQKEYVDRMPPKENLWIFLMAGQSNIAGRGKVEPPDTIPDHRILTVDSTGKWMYAKEPS